MSRADKSKTIKGAIPVYYADFYTSFMRNPVTNVLALATNENAVKQSLKNLILTNLGERFYNPNIGSKVLASLFELQDDVSENLLKKLIEEATQKEPRANIISIDLKPNEDTNSYEVSIVFSLVNIPNLPISFSIILNRAR